MFWKKNSKGNIIGLLPGSPKEFSGCEDGTWLPTITRQTMGDLAVTYTDRSGKYAKIGSTVFFQIFLRPSITPGTSSGEWRVSLPFTVGGAVNYQGACTIMSYAAGQRTEAVGCAGIIVGGNAFIGIYDQAFANAWQTYQPGSFNVISGHFFV